MRVLTHPSRSILDSEHRSCPARRHIGRQRFFNLPELLEIIPTSGNSGLGLAVIHQGLITCLKRYSTSTTFVTGGRIQPLCHTPKKFSAENAKGPVSFRSIRALWALIFRSGQELFIPNPDVFLSIPITALVT